MLFNVINEKGLADNNSAPFKRSGPDQMLAFRLRAHRGALGGCDPAALRILGPYEFKKVAVAGLRAVNSAPSARRATTHPDRQFRSR
jgi:hypothetical protein